uniref:Uncharacterized protein n=1 Tax=Strigamia maritima TaxID=126957 RepID=T1IZC9_STRMM
MNFSELFKLSNNLCAFSNNGNYLANALQHRLIIRDVKTLEITQIFTCIEDIESIEVWSLEDPSWICKIDEGTAGLINFKWTPDSRHIMSTAEFHVRITVWSLVNKSVSYIKYPKSIEMNMSFSQNGNYLALLERRNCKDYVTIFSCSSWQLLKTVFNCSFQHFEPDMNDAAGISFAPDGNCMCIWESLFEYKIALYSLSGHCIATYAADDWNLGIKTVSWCLSSQFLAIGNYDNKIHVLNHIIWKPIAEFEPSETIENTSVVGCLRTGISNSETTFDISDNLQRNGIILDRPLSIPAIKAEGSKSNLRFGVSQAVFSADNRYLMTRMDNMPTSLWIWSVKEMELVTILIQIRPIKCKTFIKLKNYIFVTTFFVLILVVCWDPAKSRLVLCTGSNKLYMWSPDGSTAVEVPNQDLVINKLNYFAVTFEICSLSWHPTGDCVLLKGKDQMCLCFIQKENKRFQTPFDRN